MEDKFSIRIRQRRKELNLSLEKLSTLSGISTSTLQRYETKGAGNMPSSKIVQIANALEVTPSYLMGWESKDLPWTEIQCIKPLFEQLSFELDYDCDTESYILKSKKDNSNIPIATEDLQKLKEDTLSYFEYYIHKIINKSTP